MDIHVSRRVLVALIVAGGLQAGCGGDGDSGSTASDPPVAVSRSPGGVWGSGTGPAESVTLLIAEDGDLRVYDVGGAAGAGSVAVDGSGRVTGTYKVLERTLVTSPILQVPVLTGSSVRSCTVGGDLVARSTLNLTVQCVSSAGGETVAERQFMYASAPYEQESTLALIAGNYTIRNLASSNTLNINADGQIFGMYSNGPRCTVNGEVKVIDPRFNLYRMQWRFASCDSRSTAYEGVSFTGFASRNPVIATPEVVYRAVGAFSTLLTADGTATLPPIAVVYER